MTVGSAGSGSTARARPSTTSTAVVVGSGPVSTSTTVEPSGAPTFFPTTYGSTSTIMSSACRAAGESRSPGRSRPRRMSCSWTHESKMRKRSRSATVPGPIGVHESAAKPASSRPRSCSMRVPVAATELGQRVGAGPRAARLDPPFVRPCRCRSSRAGGRRARPPLGSGSPRMKRSSAVMCTRLSCTVQPGHSLGCFHWDLVERRRRGRRSTPRPRRACRPGHDHSPWFLLGRRVMLARQPTRSRTRSHRVVGALLQDDVAACRAPGGCAPPGSRD